MKKKRKLGSLSGKSDFHYNEKVDEELDVEILKMFYPDDESEEQENHMTNKKVK